MLIRSASGLRGIFKDDFSPQMIDRYLASFISNQNISSCVVGRDGRPSGSDIAQWVIDTLVKYGVDVHNCDLATTPTIQLMTEKDHYDGGIVVTASHNPTEYNGLKFLQRDGTFFWGGANLDGAFFGPLCLTFRHQKVFCSTPTSQGGWGRRRI